MAGKNTEVKQIAPKQIFPDVRGITSALSDWSQGDLLIFDTTSNIVRACTAEAEAAYSLGIAQQDVVDGVQTQPYGSLATGAQVVSMAVNGPLYGNSYNMVLKTGDSLSPGALVYPYPAGGAAAVAATAASTATKAIGVYVGHVAVASAAAGTQIECLIGANYPNQTLKF